MRPGGTTPDRPLHADGNNRRISGVGQRTNRVERRLAPASEGASWEQLLCSNGPVSVAPEGQEALEFVHVAGSVLTDLTDPANPLILVAGIYILQIDIEPAANPTTTFWYEVICGTSGPVVFNDSRGVFGQPPLGFDGDASMGFAGFLPAAQNIAMIVTNMDPTNTWAFNSELGFNIVKLG